MGGGGIANMLGTTMLSVSNWFTGNPMSAIVHAVLNNTMLSSHLVIITCLSLNLFRRPMRWERARQVRRRVARALSLVII